MYISFDVRHAGETRDNVKASELIHILNALPNDPEIVTGETWLPERLLHAKCLDDLLFCQFDNAPEENEGDEEGRGFVDHELSLMKSHIMQIFTEKAPLEHKRDAILALILYAHEHSSSDVVEMLEQISLQENSLQENHFHENNVHENNVHENNVQENNIQANHLQANDQET
ncbi:VC1380 family protein [Vibrio spartinae]|uniref:Uncharacterized protein n=1 Tax=Vibrio spartinae TaxID=1918945 RepID=A0ABX6QZV9_9VIBR|nr:hypothetical protein [Vibrio spartinae]QMV14545.1 hypothetical protein Vspart_01801 [Vibrio spartinae]